MEYLLRWRHLRQVCRSVCHPPGRSEHHLPAVGSVGRHVTAVRLHREAFHGPGDVSHSSAHCHLHRFVLCASQGALQKVRQCIILCYVGSEL